MAEGSMRVTDLANQIAEKSARRHFEKRASIGVPALAVALTVPRAVAHGADKYHAVRQQLDEALEQKLAAFNPTMPGMAPGAQHFQNMMGNVGEQFGKRQTPGALAGQSVLKAFSNSLGVMGAELLKDMASKAYSAVTSLGTAAAQEAILKQLKSQDAILAEADDKMLMEAYHTMSRFAPTLSTDKNAVRSFLRQAVMSGSGPDYASIKMLADAERAVTGKEK